MNRDGRSARLRWIIFGCLLIGACGLPVLTAQAPALQERLPALITSTGSATATPFRPVHPTPTPAAAAARARPTEAVLTTRWHNVDLAGPGQKIRLVVNPTNAGVNQGRPFSIKFQPGRPCEFADHRACVGVYPLKPGRRPVILATVHSGVGGDGQALRNALEGTWIDQAAFSLDQIQRNLDSLPGAPVTLTGADQALRVLAAARIPAIHLAEYFALPVPDALELAAGLNPRFDQALSSGQPVLVIETCGWRSPAEPWSAEVTSTTAAVYLLAIGP